MESGTQGARERILKGRHVIGLFFLMMLLSAAFFTLGYVLGRNQYDDRVYAISKHIPNEPTPPNSDWDFYHAADKKADKKPDNDYLKVPEERAVGPKMTPVAVHKHLRSRKREMP